MTDLFEQIVYGVERPVFDAVLVHYQNNKHHYKDDEIVLVKFSKQDILEADFNKLTCLNWGIVQYEDTLILTCPCGCGNVYHSRKVPIQKESPLCIHNLKLGDVHFSIVNGKVVFAPNSGSHLVKIKKNLAPHLN